MTRDFDSRIIFSGLMDGELTPEQAAALFGQNIDAAGYYLCDRVGETLRDPRFAETTDLACPAGRLLELYWRLFGPWRSVNLFLIYEAPLVESFLTAKLRDALDEFTEEDLRAFERACWGKPMYQLVQKA